MDLNWLKERIERIECKVDDVKDHCNSIDKTLIKNTADIEIHIKRTDIAEQNLEKIRVEIKPINRHVIMMEGALKFVGVLALVAGLALTTLKIFSVI